MNIQEAQQAKQQLEEEIQRLLLDFASKTGLAVSSLEVGSMTYVRDGHLCSRKVTVAVSARCEL